jgi:acyl-CoA synthetase (AMP-forming)/AMP-acid ligase II
MDNIACALLETVQKRPQRNALIVPDGKGARRWTFLEIEGQVSLYAHALIRAGIKRGDRVVLMVRPSMEFTALTFALFAIGAVVILIDPGMGYKNLLRCIGSVRPEVFIGIPAAQLFKKLFPGAFKTIRTSICVGCSFGFLGKSLNSLISSPNGKSLNPIQPDEEDLAAIIFTTGSTGPPKGVQYTHKIFQSQLKMIRNYYGIKPGDVDQPAFPLFALFALCLGATAVIPVMDPTRPAKVNPKKFVRTICDYKVTYSFGSPAIWNVVSRYCKKEQIKLPSLKTVLMAGAPVPGDLVRRVKSIISDSGEVHIPYGATECLPIVSMTGSEILQSTWAKTKEGKGTCVGRALPGIRVEIIKASDELIDFVDQSNILPIDEIGEIIVQGSVVTKAYDNNDKENAYSKIKDTNGGFWHRIGDLGYRDREGRIWFCGRKAHRVRTTEGPMYSVCCEAVFNNHADVRRSALVGIGQKGSQTPIIIVEPNKKGIQPARLYSDLRKIALRYEHTRFIRHFMIHLSFPVDIRHNAKIFREKLAVWAEKQEMIKLS